MADAREPGLPRVGNGEHWTEIFPRWNVLHRDSAIAGYVFFLAWIGISIAWSWLAWRRLHARETD